MQEVGVDGSAEERPNSYTAGLNDGRPSSKRPRLRSPCDNCARVFARCDDNRPCNNCLDSGFRCTSEPVARRAPRHDDDPTAADWRPIPAYSEPNPAAVASPGAQTTTSNQPRWFSAQGRATPPGAAASPASSNAASAAAAAAASMSAAAAAARGVPRPTVPPPQQQQLHLHGVQAMAAPSAEPLSAPVGAGVSSKTDVIYLNIFLREWNVFLPLTAQNLLTEAFGKPSQRDSDEYKRQIARVAVIQGCIGIGAILKGQTDVAQYIRGMRSHLMQCFDSVSSDVMCAYVATAFCHGLVGDAAAMRNYMEFAKAVAVQLPRVSLDSELVFQFYRVSCEIHTNTLSTSPKLLPQAGSGSAACYQVLNVLTYALYDLAHLATEQESGNATADQVQDELNCLLPIIQRADGISKDHSSAFGALGTVLVKGVLAYTLVRMGRGDEALAAMKPLLGLLADNPGLVRQEMCLHLAHCCLAVYHEHNCLREYTALRAVYNTVLRSAPALTSQSDLRPFPPAEALKAHGVYGVCTNCFCRALFADLALISAAEKIAGEVASEAVRSVPGAGAVVQIAGSGGGGGGGGSGALDLDAAVVAAAAAASLAAAVAAPASAAASGLRDSGAGNSESTSPSSVATEGEDAPVELAEQAQPAQQPRPTAVAVSRNGKAGGSGSAGSGGAARKKDARRNGGGGGGKAPQARAGAFKAVSAPNGGLSTSKADAPSSHESVSSAAAAIAVNGSATGGRSDGAAASAGKTPASGRGASEEQRSGGADSSAVGENGEVSALGAASQAAPNVVAARVERKLRSNSPGNLVVEAPANGSGSGGGKKGQKDAAAAREKEKAKKAAAALAASGDAPAKAVMHGDSARKSGGSGTSATEAAAAGASKAHSG